MSRRVESEEKCRTTQGKGRFGKCEVGGGHVRGMLGSCPRLILVAVVLWRVGCRSLN